MGARAKAEMFAATVLTLFPAMFPGPLGQSLAGEALGRGLWAIEARDIREHGIGRHRAVDDTPAGGGPGMVMRADVLAASLDAALEPHDPRPRLVMSARGRSFTQAHAREWAAGPGLVILCPRFEGIDERVIEARGLVEVSIGDYVLSGGDIAALAVLDACVRLIPGVMGKTEIERGRELRSPACSNIPTILARANGKAAPFPRCCSRATTRRSPSGGGARRSASRGRDARIWRSALPRMAGRSSREAPFPSPFRPVPTVAAPFLSF